MKKTSFILAGIAVCLCWLSACNNHLKPAAQGSALEGTTWKLTGLSSLSEGLPSLSQEVTLRLDTGRVTGFAGCNRYFGAYTASGASLKFSGVASTKMFCTTGMQVETGLLESISSTDAYHIHGPELALLKGSDTLARFTVSRDTAR